MTAIDLNQIYRIARQSGLNDEGARVAVAIAQTESGLSGAVGDNGQSFGPFQFYVGGQLPAFAAALGLSPQQAALVARQQPQIAARWALNGYLGNAIKAGQVQGLSGASLATYAQANGQVSVSPERAGQNYNALFGGAANQQGGASMTKYSQAETLPYTQEPQPPDPNEVVWDTGVEETTDEETGKIVKIREILYADGRDITLELRGDQWVQKSYSRDRDQTAQYRQDVAQYRQDLKDYQAGQKPEWEPVGSTSGATILERNRITGEYRDKENPAYSDAMTEYQRGQLGIQQGQLSLDQQKWALEQERARTMQRVARGEISAQEGIATLQDWLNLNVYAPLDIAKTYQSMGLSRVGPGFGKAFSEGVNALSGGKMNVTPEAVTFQAPEFDQAMLKAMSAISPLAAQLTGSPMPQYPDAQEALKGIPPYTGPQ